MGRRNRVDPWSDLHAVPARGTFTGNRGCLVDDSGSLTRHHRGSLWITCVVEYKGWSHALDAPRTWTPLFFLDDAVALAAGHRPCGLCRRDSYLQFRDAVATASSPGDKTSAAGLNRRMHHERLVRGRGLVRASDRRVWSAPLDDLPTGSVIVGPSDAPPLLVTRDHLQAFEFTGWEQPFPRPTNATVDVLTLPTSVKALQHGFVPYLHPTAMGR